jgi:protein-glutamine gamma-glutamyltransferase
MNTPPFLIAAALLLWGWRTGWWIVAITMGVLFELSRFVKLRWEFTDKEYSRILDVCTLLFGGAMVYLRFAEEITRSGFLLFQWAPVIFALLVLVQAYGTREKIPYYIFSWFARLRRRKEKTSNEEGGLNVAWPYFGVCLLAAGATNERDPYFYLAVIALCAWATWFTRVRRYSAPIWAGCCIAATALGWVGQLGWTGLQTALLPVFGELFSRFGPKDFDAMHARTTMGEVGSKKTSGKIILRVKAEHGKIPQLLRQASYDTLKDEMWIGTRREFAPVQPENDITTWNIQAEQTNSSAVRISSYLARKRALLSLPQGVNRLHELPVGKLEMTPLGVARVNDAPGLVSYVADYKPEQSRDEESSELDLKIPLSEQAVISEIAQEIRSKATGSNALALVRAVEKFFAQNFSYALYHKENAVKNGTPLGRFLKSTRTGHCEYFASATTLLLRELKIPARYAVGFSVQESKGDIYIVRQRHAHAWVLAWLDGAWREIDTTPGSWFQMESEKADQLEGLNDFFSNLWYKFSEWRWLGQKGVISRIAPYLVLPLVAILVWRIFFRKKRADVKRDAEVKFKWPGFDSEYYELEVRLAAAGHERHPHETPKQWLERLECNGIRHPSLPALVELHYRYRFDPHGLEATERKVLRELAGARLDLESK